MNGAGQFTCCPIGSRVTTDSAQRSTNTSVRAIIISDRFVKAAEWKNNTRLSGGIISDWFRPPRSLRSNFFLIISSFAFATNYTDQATWFSTFIYPSYHSPPFSFDTVSSAQSRLETRPIHLHQSALASQSPISATPI